MSEFKLPILEKVLTEEAKALPLVEELFNTPHTDIYFVVAFGDLFFVEFNRLVSSFVNFTGLPQLGGLVMVNWFH